MLKIIVFLVLYFGICVGIDDCTTHRDYDDDIFILISCIWPVLIVGAVVSFAI